VGLIRPTDFPSPHYRQRFLKPNSYLAQARTLDREELPSETYWTGYETRPGMADLRPLILQRDEYTCQRCGRKLTPRTADIDHIRPVRRFKQPVGANTFANLWTLSKLCHKSKTQSDRQAESPVP
jgi:5-methylcytosine-specific restriction endonuclease McrA